MHKELERVKDQYVEEILELTKDGISIKNVELVDVLTHTAKNLCKLIEDDGHADSYGRRDGEYSRRDARGRYATGDGWMKDRLHRMEEEAPNEYARREYREYAGRMK